PSPTLFRPATRLPSRSRSGSATRGPSGCCEPPRAVPHALQDSAPGGFGSPHFGQSKVKLKSDGKDIPAPAHYSAYGRSPPVRKRRPTTSVPSATPSRIPREPALAGTWISQSRSAPAGPSSARGTAPTNVTSTTPRNSIDHPLSRPRIAEPDTIRTAAATRKNITRLASAAIDGATTPRKNMFVTDPGSKSTGPPDKNDSIAPTAKVSTAAATVSRLYAPPGRPASIRRPWTTSRFSRPSSAASAARDRKSTRLNSSHVKISYAVFCLKK